MESNPIKSPEKFSRKEYKIYRKSKIQSYLEALTFILERLVKDSKQDPDYKSIIKSHRQGQNPSRDIPQHVEDPKRLNRLLPQ